MIDSTFTAALAFAVLLLDGVALSAVASKSLTREAPRQIQLERVVITATPLPQDVAARVDIPIELNRSIAR